MKRTLIGGFLSLIGSIWTLAVVLMADNNLVSGWSTPPGRFLTTVIKLDLMLLFVSAVLLTLFGIAVLIYEFFKKEE